MSEDFRTIEFEVVQVRTDPTPYKVYAPELKPVKKLIITFEIPADWILEETEELIRIKPKKFLLILRKWSSTINNVFSDLEE